MFDTPKNFYNRKKIFDRVALAQSRPKSAKINWKRGVFVYFCTVLYMRHVTENDTRSIISSFKHYSKPLSLWILPCEKMLLSLYLFNYSWKFRNEMWKFYVSVSLLKSAHLFQGVFLFFKPPHILSCYCRSPSILGCLYYSFYGVCFLVKNSYWKKN